MLYLPTQRNIFSCKNEWCSSICANIDVSERHYDDNAEQVYRVLQFVCIWEKKLYMYILAMYRRSLLRSTINWLQSLALERQGPDWV